MTGSAISNFHPTIFLSEIFPLQLSKPEILCFRLTPDFKEESRQIGNRLSFHLSRKFPDVTVSWHHGDFFALAKPKQAMPSSEEWKMALEIIRAEVPDLSDRPWGIQWVRHPELAPILLARLACQILQTDCRFDESPISPITQQTQGAMVKRKVEFWPETIELEGNSRPAISLSARSTILFKGNLADFFQRHPDRHKPEEILIGLHVQDNETGGHGVIAEITGTIGSKRTELLTQATGATSKQALQEAPDEQFVVGVQFGKNPKVYEYAMAALRPRITADTEIRFGVQYGQLLRETKIRYKERQKLRESYTAKAKQTLKNYGFDLECGIHSGKFKSLFWQPKTALEQTPLLFGNNFVGTQNQIFSGLKKGGVYRKHSAYDSRPINIVALKLIDFKVDRFLSGIEHCFKQFGFEKPVMGKELLSVNGSGAIARRELEKTLNKIAALSPDIVLIFLPEDDRNADSNDGGSLYHFAYAQLLRRQIASQFIYEDTLKRLQQPSYILNQVVPGILAKLGNLPFVLAEPLEIADYYVGLDVSRLSKGRLAGTMNVCASIRLYGQNGEFLRYKLEDGLLEGEEIPQRLLERMLPADELEGKTVLIYRDGRFCGREVSHLLERASAIGSKFILVECIKSGVPRLYQYHRNEKILAAPDVGLALCTSHREAILITTKVPQKVGLARPLRLRVHEDGHPASIESVLETTLKLTLLHHGALKTPRLPMPLYGADRMAYLKLNGIYPSLMEGDRQFWL